MSIWCWDVFILILFNVLVILLCDCHFYVFYVNFILFSIFIQVLVSLVYQDKLNEKYCLGIQAEKKVIFVYFILFQLMLKFF